MWPLWRQVWGRKQNKSICGLRVSNFCELTGNFSCRLAFLLSRFTIIRLPYQYEPVPMENTSTVNEKSDPESEQSSSDEAVDEAFELENAWRVQSFS